MRTCGKHHRFFWVDENCGLSWKATFVVKPAAIRSTISLQRSKGYRIVWNVKGNPLTTLTAPFAPFVQLSEINHWNDKRDKLWMHSEDACRAAQERQHRIKLKTCSIRKRYLRVCAIFKSRSDGHAYEYCSRGKTRNTYGRSLPGCSIPMICNFAGALTALGISLITWVRLALVTLYR